MTDKEQIIIDGVNIIGTIDEWARLVAHEWGTDEYSDAEIVKNYILDINKQLARKTQEYNELTLQIRETQEYSDTCAECKDDIFTNVKTSYSQIEVESRALAKIISSLKSKTQECEELKKQFETSEEWRIKAEGLNEKFELKNTRYRKALEEIEEVLKVDFQLPCASTVCSYPNTCKDSLTNHGTKCMRFCLLNIKSIINKAKGEE